MNLLNEFLIDYLDSLREIEIYVKEYEIVSLNSLKAFLLNRCEYELYELVDDIRTAEFISAMLEDNKDRING